MSNHSSATLEWSDTLRKKVLSKNALVLLGMTLDSVPVDINDWFDNILFPNQIKVRELFNSFPHHSLEDLPLTFSLFLPDLGLRRIQISQDSVNNQKLYFADVTGEVSISINELTQLPDRKFFVQKVQQIDLLHKHFIKQGKDLNVNMSLVALHLNNLDHFSITFGIHKLPALFANAVAKIEPFLDTEDLFCHIDTNQFAIMLWNKPFESIPSVLTKLIAALQEVLLIETQLFAPEWSVVYAHCALRQVTSKEVFNFLSLANLTLQQQSLPIFHCLSKNEWLSSEQSIANELAHKADYAELLGANRYVFQYLPIVASADKSLKGLLPIVVDSVNHDHSASYQLMYQDHYYHFQQKFKAFMELNRFLLEKNDLNELYKSLWIQFPMKISYCLFDNFQDLLINELKVNPMAFKDMVFTFDLDLNLQLPEYQFIFNILNTLKLKGFRIAVLGFNPASISLIQPEMVILSSEELVRIDSCFIRTLRESFGAKVLVYGNSVAKHITNDKSVDFILETSNNELKNLSPHESSLTKV